MGIDFTLLYFRFCALTYQIIPKSSLASGYQTMTQRVNVTLLHLHLGFIAQYLF